MIVLAAAVAIAGILIAWAITAGRGIDRLEKRRVVVHTKDDQSIRGVLLAAHRDSLRLGSVEYLERAREEARGIPGEALVLRSNVSWLQVLEA